MRKVSVFVPALLFAVAGGAEAQFSGYYRVMARHSGKAITVQSASTANGANVFQWTYGGSSTNDEWEVRSIGSGYYRFINRNSGKDLNVFGASTANAANVQQWSYGGTATNDEWQPIDLGNGYHRIVARHSGKVLNVSGAGTADGANVDQWSWANVNQQQFQIVSLGGGTTPTATPTPTPTGAPPRVTPTPAPTATPNGSGFRHPGVLVNRGQLDFVKAKIQANAQPWKAAFDKAVADPHGSLSYTAHPRSVVECGPSSNPNLGCTDERGDAQAAYTHALLWYFTGNSAHASKAVQIMNAWSAVITDHSNHNAPLQTGWAGSMWAPAAEIIAHTSTAWSTSDRDRFKTMLRNVYRPELFNGSCANGNWELIMTNALMGISVFLDDRPGFDKAVSLWRGRVPAYVYQTTDGSGPRAPGHCSLPSWYGQTTFVNGVGQETCRDFGHMEWGLMAGVDTAETAYQQGLDLYAEQSKRWRDGLEFHANYDLGATVPSWLCGGSVSTANTTAWEIAYNHYVNRKGFSMPNTADMVQRVRPTGINYFIAWETLTHAGTGNTGF